MNFQINEIMKKKLFSLVMALCATTAMFADTRYGWHDDISYWVYDDGTAIVACCRYADGSHYAYNGSKYTITTANIPDSITWKDETISRVIGIEEKAFLTSVTIPKSIEYIGDYALNAKNLKTVVFNAKRCSDIGGPAFSFSVESFTFGDVVEVINLYMFDNLKNITSISIPKSVKQIYNRSSSTFFYEHITDFLLSRGCK